MRPLNSKERRVKFLLFVLLFVLSTLPLLVLVYQYGKLDVAENRFLREQYKDCMSNQSVKEQDLTKINEVKVQVRDVKELLTKKSAEMIELRLNNYAEIVTRINSVKVSDVPTYDETDKSLAQMVEDLNASLALMNEVYRSGLDKYKAFETQKELLEACNNSHKQFGE